MLASWLRSPDLWLLHCLRGPVVPLGDGCGPFLAGRVITVVPVGLPLRRISSSAAEDGNPWPTRKPWRRLTISSRARWAWRRTSSSGSISRSRTEGTAASPRRPRPSTDEVISACNEPGASPSVCTKPLMAPGSPSRPRPRAAQDRTRSSPSWRPHRNAARARPSAISDSANMTCARVSSSGTSSRAINSGTTALPRATASPTPSFCMRGSLALSLAEKFPNGPRHGPSYRFLMNPSGST